jgi:hypothetical protein
MAVQVEHGNDRDVKKLAQRLLNEASKTQVISKQEAIHANWQGLNCIIVPRKYRSESNNWALPSKHKTPYLSNMPNKKKAYMI